mmetsp:Transcript_25296/g.81816  ORF Transcript_25296/g.81816 Transcript_25296/m.81816 type:complete len:207 (+) Transcript_25296:2254-2874(+)
MLCRSTSPGVFRNTSRQGDGRSPPKLTTDGLAGYINMDDDWRRGGGGGRRRRRRGRKNIQGGSYRIVSVPVDYLIFRHPFFFVRWFVRGWLGGGEVFVGEGVDFVDGDIGRVADEVVVVGEEEHAVALLPLPHGDAGAVPVAVLGLGLLVLVEAAGTEGRAERNFVFRETADHHLRDTTDAQLQGRRRPTEVTLRSAQYFVSLSFT